jgi:oligopeptide transport system substrate-binding protein
MKSRFLLSLIAVVLATGGCGTKGGGGGDASQKQSGDRPVDIGNREQVLHIGSGTEPQDLDPHIVTGVTEHHLIMSLLEGLVTEDPKDLHPVPGVAKSWDISPDQTVFTFHLRDNARWSNGDPVTAKDFYESYKRILMPSLASQYAYMLYVVKNAEPFNEGKIKDFGQVGFKVIDDHTFQITLESPTPYFLSLMNHTSWFPIHLPTVSKYGKPYERNNKWTRPGNYVGNGSFALAEWKEHEIIVVTNSPTYWDAANVRLKAIRFYPIENEDTEEKSFRAGQLHKTETVPLSKIDVYKKNNPEQIEISPYLGNYFYRVNVTKPPLNDKRVRRALAMAIERDNIVKYITRGGQIPAHNFTPPNTAGFTATARVPSDIEGAKKLLAEAGYPGGKGMPPVEILYNTQLGHRTIAEAIQQMWKKNLGVDARISNQEWKVYLDSQKTLNYQVCRAGWIADYVDPNSFLDMFVTGGGNNETGWSNKEYDQIIKDAARATDQQKRYALFQRAEEILADECPLIPIYFYTRVYLTNPSVKGWHPTILDNHPYKYVYLEPAKK